MSKNVRQTGLCMGVLGTHAATWLADRNLGEVIALVEIALTVAVILTATYGPDKYSSRAFRLLPWTTYADTNHPDAGQAPYTSAPATVTANAGAKARRSKSIIPNGRVLRLHLPFLITIGRPLS